MTCRNGTHRTFLRCLRSRLMLKQCCPFKGVWLWVRGDISSSSYQYRPAVPVCHTLKHVNHVAMDGSVRLCPSVISIRIRCISTMRL